MCIIIHPRPVIFEKYLTLHTCTDNPTTFCKTVAKLSRGKQVIDNVCIAFYMRCVHVQHHLGEVVKADHIALQDTFVRQLWSWRLLPVRTSYWTCSDEIIQSTIAEKWGSIIVARVICASDFPNTSQDATLKIIHNDLTSSGCCRAQIGVFEANLYLEIGAFVAYVTVQSLADSPVDVQAFDNNQRLLLCVKKIRQLHEMLQGVGRVLLGCSYFSGPRARFGSKSPGTSVRRERQGWVNSFIWFKSIKKNLRNKPWPLFRACLRAPVIHRPRSYHSSLRCNCYEKPELL